ncbi:MAG: heme lyase CcmF/NrfE family subunit [Alphaproteobacteria bacterium]
MIAELGHFALALALGAALVQSIAGLAISNQIAGHIARQAAIAHLALIGFAFACLAHAFLISDFSLRVVAQNSHSAKPLLYRLSGVWGNHEGSMLLWVLMLALFGVLISVSGGVADRLRARVLGFLGVIGVAFVGFIAFTSDPFARLSPAPLDGQDLNPVLQDPALALHPPVLYFGYVGFSVAFAFAMAGLMENRIDKEWARAVRPWILLAWIALALGIAAGSYWAYYELGWGGFWFWDPVENASLLPWLAGTALLHSVIVVERRDALRAWTVFLAILAFTMSLIGTFLVRSGVLTSVHAFASNPERGLFILAIVFGLVGSALALFAWRAPALKEGGTFAPVSREGLVVVNNLFLSTIAAAVLLGTLYPVIIEALSGDLISVGPPYFNLVCGVLLVPLLALMPLGPLAAWKRADLSGVLSRVWIAALVGAAATVVVMAAYGRLSPVGAAGVAAATWLISGAALDLVERAGVFTRPPREWIARTLGLPLSTYGAALAHAGVGVTLLGISFAGAFKSEAVGTLRAGQALSAGPVRVMLRSVEQRVSPSFLAMRGAFRVEEGKGTQEIGSERRKYWVRGVTTTEVGLALRGVSLTYIVLGEPQPQAQSWTVRVYHQPLILLTWLGAGFLAAGGGLALIGRRK